MRPGTVIVTEGRPTMSSKDSILFAGNVCRWYTVNPHRWIITGNTKHDAQRAIHMLTSLISTVTFSGMYFWFLFTVGNCNTDRINTCLGSKWCQDAKLQSLAVEPYVPAAHLEEVKKRVKEEGASFLRGAETGQVDESFWQPVSVALQQIHILAMSRFLPDYQQDISRKLSSVFPISQVQCRPSKKQLAQMKTSLNAGRVNRGTMSCFPVLSTSSKGFTESLGECGLFPRLIPGTPSISCTWRKGCRVPPACFRCESCPGARDNSLPPCL